MRILFAGRKLAGRDALAWTVEQGHDVAGVLTDDFLPGSPCAALAAELGVPTFSHESAMAAVEDGSLVFDLGVSFVYWRVLRAPLLTHPARGFVNFHPAPLPALKGVGGYNVAILERMDSYGVSAHYVDAAIDTGPIIEVAPVPLDAERDTAVELEARSMDALLALYRRTLSRAATSESQLPTEENRGGRYVTRAEMEAMKRIAPADDVDLKARAFWFPPYAGAYFERGDERHTVVPRRVLDSLGGGDTHLQRRGAR